MKWDIKLKAILLTFLPGAIIQRPANIIKAKAELLNDGRLFCYDN